MTRFLVRARSLDGAASQVCQSLLSFLVLLVYVNSLAAGQFGVLAAVLLIWAVLMSLHRAVLGEQLIAQGLSHPSSTGYLDFVHLWALAGTLATAGILIAMNSPEAIFGAIYAVLFAASDAVRYWLLAARSSRALTPRSSMVIVEVSRVLLAGLALLVTLENGPSWLSGLLTLLAGGAWLLLSISRRPTLNLTRCLRFVRSKQRFEILVTLQFLLGTVLTQTLPFLALGSYGAAAFGSIRLGQSLLSPIALLTTAFQPALIQRYSSSPTADFRRIFAISFLAALVVGAVMASISIAAIWTWGDSFLPLDQIETVESLIIPLAVLVAMVVVGQPGGAIIRVRRLGNVSLWGQLIGVVISLIVCFLALPVGLVAFTWAMAVGAASTVGASYILLWVSLNREARDGGNADRYAV